jgi:arabinose-5-phosphate isomerase
MNRKSLILKVGKDVLKTAADNITRSQEMLGDAFYEAVELLYNTKGHIVVSGIGKSGIIAKKIAATLSSTGTFSYYMHPNEAFHGDFGLIKAEDTILIFSHSGETEELIRFLAVIKDLHKENKIITITSGVNSSLALCSDISLYTHVAKENDDNDFKLIPTTSTTVTLAIGDAIAISLQKIKGFKMSHFLKYHPGGNIGKQLRQLDENFNTKMSKL